MKEYDDIKVKLTNIRSKLKDYLAEIRKKLKSKRIIFAHVRHRYELEIPLDLVAKSKKPDWLEFSSKKKGVERFVTKEIKKMV